VSDTGEHGSAEDCCGFVGGDEWGEREGGCWESGWDGEEGRKGERGRESGKIEREGFVRERRGDGGVRVRIVVRKGRVVGEGGR